MYYKKKKIRQDGRVYDEKFPSHPSLLASQVFISEVTPCYRFPVYPSKCIYKCPQTPIKKTNSWIFSLCNMSWQLLCISTYRAPSYIFMGITSSASTFLPKFLPGMGRNTRLQQGHA